MNLCVFVCPSTHHALLFCLDPMYAYILLSHSFISTPAAGTPRAGVLLFFPGTTWFTNYFPSTPCWSACACSPFPSLCLIYFGSLFTSLLNLYEFVHLLPSIYNTKTSTKYWTFVTRRLNEKRSSNPTIHNSIDE